MKKIILLFCFAVSASMSYGQFKVTSDGINNALNRVMIVGADAAAGTAEVRVGEGRASAGGSAFYFFNSTATGPSNAAFGMGVSPTGVVNFQSDSGNFLQFRTIDAQPMIFRTANAVRMTIGATGSVAIAGSASVNGGVAVTSDLKTKKNIDDFQLGLEEVLKLRPVSYEYNGVANTNPNGRSYVGLIAQELEKVAPNFVSNHEVNNYAENGDIISTEEILKIHDTELKYLLVNAIQEQQILISDQADKISELQEAMSTFGSSETLNNTTISLSSYDLAELNQNTPNPFNNQTTISYVVPTDAQNAQISIFGQNGQLMKTLDIDHVGQGNLTVNADNLPSGTYSYQLVVDGRSIQTNVMVVAN